MLINVKWIQHINGKGVPYTVALKIKIMHRVVSPVVSLVSCRRRSFIHVQVSRFVHSCAFNGKRTFVNDKCPYSKNAFSSFSATWRNWLGLKWHTIPWFSWNNAQLVFTLFSPGLVDANILAPLPFYILVPVIVLQLERIRTHSST